MNSDKSYLTERQAERRRRVRAGVLGVGVLMALGMTLLLSHPDPRSAPLATSAATVPPLGEATLTALR